MPFRIQRVPRGLNDVLNIFGGAGPVELEDRVRATLDTLQLYGNTQRTIAANTTVAAENAPLNITVPNNQWWILFGASLEIAKTATMTALRGVIEINGVGYASAELGPFGATETGNTHVCFAPSYPMLLAPRTVLAGRASIIGTDANATCSFEVDIGVLG